MWRATGPPRPDNHGDIANRGHEPDGVAEYIGDQIDGKSCRLRGGLSESVDELPARPYGRAVIERKERLLHEAQNIEHIQLTLDFEVEEPTKKCGVCRLRHPLHMFKRNRLYRDKLAVDCRRCQTASTIRLTACGCASAAPIRSHTSDNPKGR